MNNVKIQYVKTNANAELMPGPRYTGLLITFEYSKTCTIAVYLAEEGLDHK